MVVDALYMPMETEIPGENTQEAGTGLFSEGRGSFGVDSAYKSLNACLRKSGGPKWADLRVSFLPEQMAILRLLWGLGRCYVELRFWTVLGTNLILMLVFQ